VSLCVFRATSNYHRSRENAKSQKKLLAKVDTGLDVRTIVSGIAESFTPEEIVGKKLVLVNLAPRALHWCR
jgi:tRNA-binding EMAP/Myf-like protein